MKSEIKTTNDEYKHHFYIVIIILITFLFLFLLYVLIIKSERQELKEQNDKIKEEAIKIGQNSTINYIIANKKYPTKFKGNIVWLTRSELCEDD